MPNQPPSDRTPAAFRRPELAEGPSPEFWILTSGFSPKMRNEPKKTTPDAIGLHLYLTPVFQPGIPPAPLFTIHRSLFTISRNEPNFNPRPPRIMRNKPNLPQAHNPNARNKPNLPQANSQKPRAKIYETNPISAPSCLMPLASCPNYTKRTQSLLLASPKNTKRTQSRPTAYPKCAKRTQFAPRRTEYGTSAPGGLTTDD